LVLDAGQVSKFKNSFQSTSLKSPFSVKTALKDKGKFSLESNSRGNKCC